jgi:hypothetical protein
LDLRQASHLSHYVVSSPESVCEFLQVNPYVRRM